jgi:hypothetical protein
MHFTHKSVAWLDLLAFVSPALAVLSIWFFWMPAVGVCLSAFGLVLGFFGWLTASQNEDASASYLLSGAILSAVALVFNLTLVTGAFFRIL